MVIEYDPSMQGWGAVCRGVRTGGKWTVVETDRAPHQCAGVESNTISIVILFEGQGQHISRMDNRAAIAHINKMEDLILSPLPQMAQEFWN